MLMNGIEKVKNYQLRKEKNSMGRPKKIKSEVAETKIDGPAEMVKSFSVFDKTERFVREYTEEIHGEEAEELAKRFALKINGTIK